VVLPLSSDANVPPPGKPPLPVQMRDLITAYWVSQLIFVAAELGIADQLHGHPRTVTDLSKRVGADAGRLHRVLRALATVGVVTEQKNGRFALTSLGGTLRADAPGSMRAFALMIVDDHAWRAWARLIDGVKAPMLPFDSVHGMPVFDYLDQHPAKRSMFAAAMASISGTENPAVATAYDFGKLRTLVDVGGSQGHLLAEVLRHHPHVLGTLFDLEPVIAGARTAPFLTDKTLSSRVQFAAGSFFEGVPPGADAYMMKYVLHDWDDDQCVQILTHCRKAMRAGGRVLVIDTMIPAGNAPHWGKLLDINMLALTGGRERTKADFAALFEHAGLKLKKVHATACQLSIVEGVEI
jgi:hypothetical protein